MKSPWRYLRPGDGVVIIILLLVAAAGFIWLGKAPAGGRVVVSDGEGVCFSAGLDQPQAVELEGPLGKTRLEIVDGAARIVGSPCPQQLCVRMGPARRTGELIACVPNRLLLRIEGPSREEAPYDLLSR